ncbi:MAG TPA: hypothetical protein VFS67_05565 [Polyangiaceae bacterium]|jgi:hypothetical protein|nr:hypothetical protein [Polyangiaceae bacterium]
MRSEPRLFTAVRVLYAALGLCSTIACSGGSDVASQVSGNAAAPEGPADGVLTGNPLPGGVLDAPADGPAPLPQASGAGAPPVENPPPAQPPGDPSASGAEPQPTATETNFFGAGCLSDADCGEQRRCEFPVSEDTGAAPSPVGADAGSSDAGADAAVPPPFVPRGHCVSL